MSSSDKEKTFRYSIAAGKMLNLPFLPVGAV
jgi:hypothetical protein